MNIATLRRKNIAVIGSGVAGLSCAWWLSKTQQVTLFEKDDRLGGHANTVSFDLAGKQVDVDTGFIVYNPVNYPNLVALFDHLDVESCATDMSFGVSLDNGSLEYSGTGLGGLFAQRSNWLKPGFWQMLADVKRFYRNSQQLAEEAEQRQLSLGQLLSEHKFSERFIYHHLLPMGAAIWSTPVDQMLDYPASSFMRFCQNHGLLQLEGRPQWRTVVGGSIQYVNKLSQGLEDIRLNSHIHRVHRYDNYVELEDLHGGRERFDQVVFACHSDQALAMLAQPTEQELRLLSKFGYQRNRAYLHMDTELLPKRQRVWSSWNYMAEGERKSAQISVSYLMNKLQPLNTDVPIVVSLNPAREPNKQQLIRSFFYHHPVFDQQAIASQSELWSLQGQSNSWFCGAYFGYGFHEDGLQAGLAVAEQLGGLPRPWRLANANSRIHVERPTGQEVGHYG